MSKIFTDKAAQLLEQFDPNRLRASLERRPAMIELFGTPKAGKTTIKEMLKLFFKRNGWSVSSPTEGAEVVEWNKRREPEYNFQTAEYALSVARERAYGPGHRDFHLVIFDRGIYDGAVRMEHYLKKKLMTRAERDVIEGYYLNRWNRDLFDLHICMVCDPSVAIERELARAIVKKHGETMNPGTLEELRASHDRLWKRLRCHDDQRMSWQDTTGQDVGASAVAVLHDVLGAINRRPDLSAK